jgi:radical SAM superfamily enzyme YgiQ (UPF0313 family)
VRVTDERVCLIRPPAVESFRFVTTSLSLPLGLAYVAGSLRAAGADVAVVDAVGEAPDRFTPYLRGFLVGLSLEELARRIPPDARFVGVAAAFTHEWPAVAELTRLIRRARPDAFIVLGGEHASAMPEFCLATSEADALVLGEGEETAVELWRAFASGSDLAAVDGAAFRRGGAAVVNPRRARRTDVDAIPAPAWDLFHVARYHERRYAGGVYSGGVTIPILATRGCPYSCTYCSSPGMWTTEWIARDPVLVVDEIERHVRDFGATNFPFQDLTAILRKDWTVRFCEELLRRGLKIAWQFPSGTRCEAIDRDVARLMKRSGMIMASYAPESGDEETRRLVKKRMSTRALEDSVRAAASEGLNVCVFVVIGFPRDTRASVGRNVAFLERMAALGVTDVSVAYYMALPGTELFRELDAAGRIRLDRDYFRHILQSMELFPTRSYCAELDRGALTRWKLRLNWAFYGGAGLLGSLRRAFSGFGRAGHASKLPTAVRHGLTNLWRTVLSRRSRPWTTRARERELLAGFDAAFRELRRRPAADAAALAK